MAKTCLPVRAFLLAVLAACSAIALAGCRTIDLYDASLDAPVLGDQEPPRELSMISLPAYRLEPPDLIMIEMLKQVPLPPYRAEAYDVLQIRAAGTFADQPIDDYYLVEAEGTVSLGPVYGTVRVIGMTIEEIRNTIDQNLRQILAAPEVSVQLARSSGTQPVTNEYIVGPDGTVNLRQYGSVRVAGMTVGDAKAALEKHLSQYFDSPEVAVSVRSYNSKFYYIITEGAGLGDDLVSIPVTGNETVLDAISNIGGLSQLSSKQIWIARPGPNGMGCEQVLPVDYDAIVKGGDTRTNYQILPEDRLFIAENETIALTSFIGKVIGPVERLFGFTSLGVSTIRGTSTMGRGYNKNRR